jgi:hypothetical protein
MEEVSEVSASIAGQKITIKSMALNTLATVATLIGVAVIIVLVWQHDNDTRETSKDFITSIKDQTTAMKDSTQVGREQNCLLKFDQKDRMQNAEFCKQITR